MRIKVSKIYEDNDIVKYLEKRNLIKQYKKAKNFILSGYGELADFKLREPKSDGVYYFRINKQYRACGRFRKKEEFIVIEIDNHQD